MNIHILHFDRVDKRDPTQAEDLRKKAYFLFNRAIAEWKFNLRQLVIAQDALSLLTKGYSKEERYESLHSLAASTGTLAFTRDVPGKLEMLVNRAFIRGRTQAYKEFGLRKIVHPTTLANSSFAGKARAELETAVQGMAKDIANMSNIYLGNNRQQMWGFIIQAFNVGNTRRLKTLGTTNITRAVNAGKIEMYALNGVKQVGIIPETIVEKKKIRRQSFLDIDRFRIETAGDNRVCNECDTLSRKVYTLEQVHTLIPAHPNCRCAVFMVASDG